MISEKQLEANRRNAQKSTGPRTDAGKQRSSLNARRHHLTGQVTTMTEPDRASYEKFTEEILADIKAEGAMETQLAMSIAHDRWRLNRAAAIEDNLFAIGVDDSSNPSHAENHPEIDDAFSAALVFTREAKNLQLLTLYEQRINRTLQKNMALLKSMQAEREAQRAKEMEEAKRLLQLSEMRNLQYDPKRDGFVFSNEEIYSAIDRQRRLERAAMTDFSPFQRRRFRSAIASGALSIAAGTASNASPQAA